MKEEEQKELRRKLFTLIKSLEQEEPKEETIEQASERYANMHQDVSGKLGKYLVKAVFQDGANYQAKQMYSEEDMRESFKQSRQCEIFQKDMPPVYNTFEEWFNEFKKR